MRRAIPESFLWESGARLVGAWPLVNWCAVTLWRNRHYRRNCRLLRRAGRKVRQ